MHLLSSANLYFHLKSDMQAYVIIEHPAQGKILYFHTAIQKHSN